MENRKFDGTAYTMAHLAFHVTKDEFFGWVDRVRHGGFEIGTGPKELRGGGGGRCYFLDHRAGT